MAASSSLEVHVVDYSESIRSIHRVQFGIDLVEETLDFVALVRARISSRRLSGRSFRVSSSAMLVIEDRGRADIA
jgi:hypothetical protein